MEHPLIQNGKGRISQAGSYFSAFAGKGESPASPIYILPLGAGTVSPTFTADSLSVTETKVVGTLSQYLFHVMPMSARDGRRSL